MRAVAQAKGLPSLISHETAIEVKFRSPCVGQRARREFWPYEVNREQGRPFFGV